jgi:hypothetical protein
MPGGVSTVRERTPFGYIALHAKKRHAAPQPNLKIELRGKERFHE